MSGSAARNDERIDMRLPQKEKSAIERAAQMAGQSVSSYMRAALAKSARETIETETTWTMSQALHERFMQIHEGPAPEPTPAMLEAIKLADTLDIR